MSIYQRYLSKSLIFFSSVIIIFFVFIESNTGFKLFFNFTNRLFLGFKVEEISGNWRNFTLKNINYNNSKVSIQANSIHIILDIPSLFNVSTIFKEIETNNLMILFKKENISTHSIIQKLSFDTIKQNIFIKYPVIFQKIHSDKILIKTSNINILLSNFFGGVKLINNNITFFPTNIDTIHVVSSNITLKENLLKNNLSNFDYLYKKNKINNFLHFLSTQSNIFIPFNINFISVKCKNVNLIDHKISNFFSAELRAKIEDNILKIKKIKIYNNIISIKSYGKIIFSHDTIICNIKNKILIPKFYKKVINFSFKSFLNNKFMFQLIFNNLYKINIHGEIFLDDLNHPFQIYFTSKNLFFSIKKNITLEIKKFKAILTGEIDNYSLSFQQIFKICDMPSIFIDINGNGNLKNIFLKKINFSLLKSTIFNKKKNELAKNIIHNPYILELIGKTNIIGKTINNTYNLCAPKISIDTKLMQKKLSILGSLCYRNLNVLETSGINLLAGKNKLYLKGFIGKKNNIYSSILANNLDYFFPNLKGKIESVLHVYGNYMHPVIMNQISVNNLNWKDNLYLKSIKILSNMNIKNKFLGNFLLDIKKAQFFQFYINSLHIYANWNNKNQKFCFLFKSPILYMNIMLNSIIDDKTGHWYGFLKKIHIKTFWGKFITKKVPFSYFYNSHSIINNFYTKKIKVENFFSSLIYKTKKSFLNILNKPFINFTSELFIQTKLKWILGKNISYGNILLNSQNIKLERKNKELTFYENIDYLHLSLNLIHNDLKSKWIIKKSITSLEKQDISGQLNVLDLYNQKKLEGKFVISNFPLSFINLFTTKFKQVKGRFNSQIKFFGSLYCPQVLANVNFKNILIKSDNILRYISLFFPYFLGKLDHIKINQEIIMEKGDLLFTFNKLLSNSNHIQWNLLFKSKKVEIVSFSKIKFQFSSKLNLHYFLKKYDLIGYIKFSFFYFKINEKNFMI
ncbi:hypothetical protein [Buchnera aphidicola]|uniref:hypothetical protein n=1 Tax=Buchnera aphidicola TaxID=9 RepID=UPI0003E3EB1C|nr:hypothetical protein [Buchnera aphidicola]AHG62004.1 Ytfn [Buchnera aphidicola str. F009 (Myzus persicae)]